MNDRILGLDFTCEILEISCLALGQVVFDGKLEPTGKSTFFSFYEDDVRKLKKEQFEYLDSLR